MEIKLYPNFEEVFKDSKLKGIFYPLCTYKNDKQTQFHFVSSNGLWVDEKYNNDHNTFEYALFEIVDGKYSFNGDIRLYKGHEAAKKLFPMLETDFKNNGNSYLEDKLSANKYISKILNGVDLDRKGDFDAEYFAQTFYEYSINKLNYELTGKFASYRKVIDNWPSAGEKSPVVYDKNTDEFLATLNHLEKPNIKDFESSEAIGKVVGCEFFTDGNDTFLLFNKTKGSVMCLNTYS